MVDRPAPVLASDRDTSPTRVWGGIAAVAGGLAWAVKSGAILLTGRQPALLFDLAPPLLALALLSLGQQLPPGSRRRACVGMAATAVVLGSTALTDTVVTLPTVAYSLALAGSNLLILACLVTAGLSLRRRLGAALPLGLGLGTVPALLAGGLAAAILGERAVEVPLLLVGVGWTMLGVQLIRGRYEVREM